MKKIIILLFSVFIFTSSTVYASPLFDEILSDKVNEYGVFDGNQGIVYANKAEFEGRNSLLIVHIISNTIKCEVYDDADGIQLTDTLEFSCGGGNAYSLSKVSKNNTDYILLSSTIQNKTSNEFFTIQNDAFTKTASMDYDTITSILEYRNEKFISYIPVGNIYSLMSDLKQETISQYTFTNKLGSITDDEISQIRTTLSACADIMRFDIKNYDYDTLFKYVLYTHKNFSVLTDIPPNSGSSSSLGYNNVSIVSSDFIDYVMNNVFHITPEKPPVNNLLTRGFCYSSDYYYYTGGFDIYFATEIRDIAGIYDIGGGVTFVVFTDVYYEGNTETPEYSFAVLQKSGNGYSLLRLGMGENLPSQEEVREYSPFSNQSNSTWDDTSKKSDKKITDNNIILPVLLLIFSVGIVGLICGIIALVRMRRK